VIAVRGIRGATTAHLDSAVEIVDATRELLQALIDANDIRPDDVAGAWFTTTVDLRTEFPAVAARQLGWVDVPLICGHEMNVLAANPRSSPRCIRIMILLNTDRPQSAIRHVYLRGALAIKEELDRARAGDLPEPAQLELPA
jgi:chorismate mutase